MPKALSFFSWVKHYLYTVSLILLLGEVIAIPYSYCVKEGLSYIAIVSPFSCQPSSYSKCTYVNMRLSYNIYFISNTKYTRPITLNSL